MATFTPTKQQQDVLDTLRSYFEAKFGPGYNKRFAIFLSAVAGAGKTSTIMLIAALIAELEKEYNTVIEWVSLSFNRPIMLSSNKKYRENGFREVAKTTNSLGRGILDEASKSGQCHKPGKLNSYKYKNLIEKYCQENRRKIPALSYNDPLYMDPDTLVSKIRRLVSAARLTFCDTANEQEFVQIVEHYRDTGIDPTSPYWPFIWQAVAPVIDLGIKLYEKTGEHDFDDQIFLPLALNVTAPIYDFIAIDEAQDLNRVRTELVTRSLKPNGAMFFVGDRKQAIQGFAYADTAAVDNIISLTNAVEMPLTCCWRCDENIIKLAKVLNPAIEARPGADPGIVDVLSEDEYIEQLQAGYWSKNKAECKEPDMVLCRVTADLVKGCLAAIRIGKYAIVRGKSIGDKIIKTLDKILVDFPEGNNLKNLSNCAQRYYNEMAFCIDDEEELDRLNDEIQTIQAFIDGYMLTKPADHEMTISTFKKFIESKFQGDEGDPENEVEGPLPIVFTTVHKAKGLETDHAYIIRGELMPHPMSMKHGKQWQIDQEYNILYVAVTRAKHHLTFVGYIPTALRDEFNTVVHDEPLMNAIWQAEEAAAVAEAETIIAEAAAETSQETPVEAEQTAQTSDQGQTPAPVVERPKTGRKAYAEADKKVPVSQFLIDPSVKAAFAEFMDAIEKGAVDVDIPHTGKTVSASEVWTAALLNFKPFADYFQTSEHSTAYNDRLARQAQAREAYKNRGKKKTVAAQPEDDQPGPEDDDPGGGEPAPNNETKESWSKLVTVERSPFAPYGANDAYISKIYTKGEDEIFSPKLTYTTEEIGLAAMKKMWGDEALVVTSDEFERLYKEHQNQQIEALAPANESAPTNGAQPALFADIKPVQAGPDVKRIFYTCSSKFCGRIWYTDYYVNASGELYRVDEKTGVVIYAANDFNKCPWCNNEKKYIKRKVQVRHFSTKRPCDSRCWNAKPGSDCTCQCGGTNHGTGHSNNVTLIGRPLLQLVATRDEHDSGAD